jgi:hypothetical protein
LDISFLHEAVFIIQELDERNALAADGIEALGVGKKIDEVGADTTFEFWIASK